MNKIFLAILILAVHIVPRFSLAGNLQIEFTENDSYSVEVARIQLGDTIEWLPKNEGHNVEFLAGPEISALPQNSDMDVRHSVVFTVPGIYLYGCTPHANMGMLGLVIVGNDIHNLESIKKTRLSSVGLSVLRRLLKIAVSDKN